MSILVVAETNGRSLHPATRNAVTAASQMGGDLHVLVAGGADAAAQAAKLQGVAKVLHAPCEGMVLAETIAPLVASLGKNYSHVVAAATTTGKDFMPRVAALLDVAQISEITKVNAPDNFTRPFYAGNALETVQALDAIKVITVRQTAFAAAAEGGAAAVEAMAAPAVSAQSSFVAMDASNTGRPDLATARVVVSGGRGVGSAENFKIIEALADKLGGAVGASRAAVDAGYVPNDYQVGQTGKVVAPELYIAVGISGAIQHLAGMKESKVIVAINKDENAPIFEVADYGLVADLFVAVPEMQKLLG